MVATTTYKYLLTVSYKQLSFFILFYSLFYSDVCAITNRFLLSMSHLKFKKLHSFLVPLCCFVAIKL